MFPQDDVRLTGKRLRRLKCDEARPVCRRCSLAHLLCGGYAGGISTYTIERWMRSGNLPETLLLTQLSSATVPRTLPRTITHRGGTDPVTHEILAHFCSVAAEAIPHGNEKSFWTTLFSSDLSEHGFVRQAALAASSFHRHRLLGEAPSQNTLKWRDDAICSLKMYQPPGTCDVQSVLTAAVLLIWCEVKILNTPIHHTSTYPLTPHALGTAGP